MLWKIHSHFSPSSQIWGCFVYFREISTSVQGIHDLYLLQVNPCSKHCLIDHLIFSAVSTSKVFIGVKTLSNDVLVWRRSTDVAASRTLAHVFYNVMALRVCFLSLVTPITCPKVFMDIHTLTLKPKSKLLIETHLAMQSSAQN